jgi:YD repeat-containing protein
LLTDPLDHESGFSYNFAGRIDTVTRPDETTEALTAVQMQGLTDGGSEESPAAPVLAVQASANYTDPRGHLWETYTDWLGFGLEQQAIDPLGDMAVAQHDPNGLDWLAVDPLARYTRDFFDEWGNPTEIVNADDTYSLYVYNDFSEVTEYTDPRGYVTAMSYDAVGKQGGKTARDSFRAKTSCVPFSGQ